MYDDKVLNVTYSLPAAIDDLFEVMVILRGLTDWKILGLALGLLYPTLEYIEKDNDRNDECWMKMLAAWLRRQDNVYQKGVPSWSVLRAALKSVGENELGEIVLVSCGYKMLHKGNEKVIHFLREG